MTVDREISILGTIYTIGYKKPEEDSFLEKCDGYCDASSKSIVINKENRNKVGDWDAVMKQSLRHEIIHAYLNESGLQHNFQHCNEFGHEETMVDWFAIQFYKISKTFEELGI